MNFYSDFDYLCNEPFFVQNIGYLKCPTLREVRKVTYNVFVLYVNILLCTLEEYLKSCGLEERYNSLSDKEKQVNSLFNLLLYGNTDILMGVISTFVVDEVLFDKESLVFQICHKEGEVKKQIGHIGADNFDEFRNEVLKILGLGQVDTTPKKFKTKRAQHLVEKISKAKSEVAQKSKQDENMLLDNMVKKYCTHNKVGINILNVWDMTYYQFMQMFSEYYNGRQCDYNDMIAANTFSYKEASDYKPMLWLEKLNKS